MGCSSSAPDPADAKPQHVGELKTLHPEWASGGPVGVGGHTKFGAMVNLDAPQRTTVVSFGRWKGLAPHAPTQHTAEARLGTLPTPTLHPHTFSSNAQPRPSSAHSPRPPCPSLSFSPHAQPRPSSEHSPRPPCPSHVPTQPTAEAKLGITINDGPPKPKRTAYRPEEEQRLGTPTLIVVDVAENGRRAGARVGMVVVAVNGQALYEPALCSITNHDEFSRFIAVECSGRPLALTMEEPVVPGSDTDVTAERVRGWEVVAVTMATLDHHAGRMAVGIASAPPPRSNR